MVDIKDLNFEEALTQLNTIVQKMESGQISLEESVKAYEMGIALKKHCDMKLKEAELKIEKIRPESLTQNGDVETTPF